MKKMSFLFIYEFMGIAVNLFCSLSLSLICICIFWSFDLYFQFFLTKHGWFVYQVQLILCFKHFFICLYCLLILFSYFHLSFCAVFYLFMSGYIAGPSSNNILGLVPRGLFVPMYNCYWLYFEYCRVNYTDMLFFFSLLRQEREALYTRDGSDDVDHGPQQETVHIRRCSFQRGRNGASACAWRTKSQ